MRVKAAFTLIVRSFLPRKQTSTGRRETRIRVSYTMGQNRERAGEQDEDAHEVDEVRVKAYGTEEETNNESRKPTAEGKGVEEDMGRPWWKPEKNSTPTGQEAHRRRAWARCVGGGAREKAKGE